MACDICGENGKPLVDLLPAYQTEKVKQICPECEKTINNQLWKIRAVTAKINQSLVQRFMTSMKTRLMGPNAKQRAEETDDE